MYDTLKRTVCEANKKLFSSGLDPFCKGGISAADRRHGIAVIRPELPYSELTYEKMTVVSLSDGSVIEGEFGCAGDIAHHLSVYKAFENIGSAAHITAPNTAAWAQAKRAIPIYGDIHKSVFGYPVYCVDCAVNNFGAGVKLQLNSEGVASLPPAVLLSGSSGFAFGEKCADAYSYAEKLELIAEAAFKTEFLSSLSE